MRICWPAGQQASFSEAVLGKTDLLYGVEQMSKSAHNTSRISKPSTFLLLQSTHSYSARTCTVCAAMCASSASNVKHPRIPKDILDIHKLVCLPGQ